MPLRIILKIPIPANRFPKKSQEYVYWNHTLEEIITVLADAGLRIESVHAFPFTCFQQFTSLEQHEDGFYYFPAFFKQFPYYFAQSQQNIKNYMINSNTTRDA